MIVSVSIVVLFASLPTCRSKGFNDEDLSINVNFAKEFIDRLNKATLEHLQPTETDNNRYNEPTRTVTEFLHEFAKDVASTGAKHLKNVAIIIRKIMKAQSDNNNVRFNENPTKYDFKSNEYLKQIVMSYTNAIKCIYNYTVEHYVKKFDQKSVLLNFVEETNEELFTKKMLLLKHHLVYFNGKMSPKWSTIREIITFDYMEQKHLYLQELCYKREICTPYPGFSDFLVNLIDDVTSLPAGNFNKFMQIVIRLITEKRDFFGSVVHEKDFVTFSVIVDYFDKGDYFAARSVLHKVRNFIKDKFKLIKITDPALKCQTKAIRMLMEIVDRVFEKDGQELMRITFGNLRSVLKASATGNILDAKKVFADFIKHSVNLCASQWGQESIEEVKTLVEASLKGSSLINPELLRDLFQFGSEFLQRDPVDLYML